MPESRLERTRAASPTWREKALALLLLLVAYGLIVGTLTAWRYMFIDSELARATACYQWYGLCAVEFLPSRASHR